ncbi:MAG: DEAD/DEAH box helicase [Rhodospirillaceae bacterium]|nr:DEAD/DEAH box helicase [Rhodospirillaceae bacterium]|tara:strand:- start:5299 stop:6642 length:1344 start_codon:yes stop_codon:yes gene_type:complete
MIKFSELNLIEPLQKSLLLQGYEIPTAIQAQSIPFLIKGKDLLGVAQTGTGKTAAFSLPLLQSLTRSAIGRPKAGKPRALILAPTRELAIQIGDSIKIYGKFLSIITTTIYGGISQLKQIAALNRGVDIVVSTPGRLLDLINQNKISLKGIEFYVLDEADRMLDMGFIHDVKKITKQIPEKRQTLLFSATMPNEIANLAKGLLNNPVKIEVAVQSTTADRIDQQVLFVEKSKKRNLLSYILEDKGVSRALVFTRTKHGANRVAKYLEQQNIRTGVIHGNKSQNARQNALKGFKDGKLRILVATDIAARGIDIDKVTHVINFNLPNEPEIYVHRIGRTARAGLEGQAISFCDEEERDYLFDIERVIRKFVDVRVEHPFHAQNIRDAKKSFARKNNNRATSGANGEKRQKLTSSHKKKRPKGGNKHGIMELKNIKSQNSRKKRPQSGKN